MTVYTSYEQAKYDEIFADDAKTASNFESYTNTVTSPDLDDFLAHQWQQWEKAMETGDTDNRWDAFLHALIGATEALRGEGGSVPMAFLNLGREIQRLKGPDDETVIAGLQALKSETERAFNSNVVRRNIENSTSKEVVKEYAGALWIQEEFKDYRIHDMAKKIHEQFKEFAKRKSIQFPQEPEGLRPWLREVAPESAKKPGAPPKKKP